MTTTSAEGETKYQYDDQGNLIYVKTPNNEVVSYTYDEYGRKESLRYPDGKKVFYEYDAMDRLIAVRGLDGAKTEYTYNAAGQRTQTNGGGLTTKYEYDSVGNLTAQKTTGRTELSLEYLYDLNNRMLTENRTESGNSVKSEYVYDKLGQIESFQTSEGYSESYAYDAAGNMTQKKVNEQTISMTYNAANELKTMQSEKWKIAYSYDESGNLTQKELDGKKDTYQYDALNRLTSYVGYDGYALNYTYNAQSMMSARETKGNPNRNTLEEIVSGKKEEPSAEDDEPDPAEWVKTSYTYDVTAPYYEVLTETTNGTTTAYDYGVERLASYTGASAWNTIKTQYVYDGRGSAVQELSNNNSWYTFGGTLSKTAKTSYSYTPFGELLTEEGTGYRFNGEYYDSATGMVNLRARQYEPAVMRFNQRDVWHGTLALTLAQNRYQYCLNDPQNLYDYGGNIIAGKKTVLTPPRTIIKAADAKKTINTAAAIKAIAEQQRIDALSDTGIDTRGYNSDMRRIVENTEKELRRRARAGTLTAGDRQNLIATACNTIKTLQTWEQLKDPNYWKRSWDVAVKGDYAEDFTGAGLAMQVGLGLIPGVGQAADIRDFIYAVSHTKDNSFWVNASLITLALVALIPVVGDLAKGLKGVKYLKYADEAADVLDAAGDVAKYGDDLIDAGADVVKHGDAVADQITTVYRAVSPDEFDEIMSTGHFNIIPDGLQVKQFGLSFDETLKYADNFSDYGAIVEAKVPQSVLDKIADNTPLDPFVFKSGTVTIPFDSIDEFNRAIQGVFHKY